MAKGYKINRSNYTIRRRHQLVNNGQVTERDFMTTTNLGPWDSGSIPYGESNFRMFYRNPENVRKQVKAGSWIKSGCDGEADEFWNGGCLPKSGITEERLIVEKPNYKSLLDFAYFGSCEELIKSTVKKIVEDFPGEINVRTIEPFDINGDQYYLVNNPFGIDLFDKKNTDGLRDFANNYDKYEAVVGSNTYAIRTVTVSDINPNACEHGDIVCTVTIRYGSANIVISEIIYDTNPMLFTTTRSSVHIRPKAEYLDEFFDKLDDFGKLLLNKNTNPLYTATIDWPHETDYGLMTHEKSFTWPVDGGGWNLDITSSEYEKYITELLSVAEFYDEGYTNNLWRMLTHDSVKNMDLAFSNPAKDEDKEDYNYGTTRLQGLLWAYGRQFDEIKRSIDNIKRTSTISYDQNGNMPDYFLSDALELAGWEVYNADTGINDAVANVDWGSVSTKYSSEVANDTFLRELKLNSKYIFSKKGTVEGIVSLLGLFGMVSGVDYTIKEHVYVVQKQIETDEDGSFNIAALNENKATSDTDYPYGYNIFDGLPLTYVISNGKKYIIPWFDDELKYDGGTYFQMKGGWLKQENKYEETIKYLSVLDNPVDRFSLPKAKRYENAICYIENVEENQSHYYMLVDVDKFNEEGGWTQDIPQGKIDYIESIIDDYKGNNPHVGYGNYDGGEEFLERIKYPFKPTEEFLDGAYDCNGNLNQGYSKEWVKLGDPQEDNKKVWFFGEVSGGTLTIDYNVFDFEKGNNGQMTTTPSEPSANSIINVKTIDFEFFILSRFTNDFKNYLNESVLPYLKQMIPSTAIWTVKVTQNDAMPFDVNKSAQNPYTLEVDGLAFADHDADSNNDFITNYNEDKWLK